MGIANIPRHRRVFVVRLNKNQKCLFSIHVVRGIMELFTNTFLTSHIISMTSDNIFGGGLFNAALFYAMQYIFYGLFYFLISFLVKKSNRVIFLQLSMIVNLALVIGLVFWADTISNWIILTGALCGLSNAFYYASYFVMKNEFAERVSIKKYNILTVIGVNVIKIVMPTILGVLIDSSSFSNISIYMSAITLIQIVISLFIKPFKENTGNLRFLKYYKNLREDKEARSKIKYTYLNAILSGIKNTYKLILTVLILYTYKTNFGLGLFTSISSLITMGLLILFKIFDNNPKTNKLAIYIIIGFLPLISSIVLAFWLNEITLVIFNFFLTVAIYFSDYFGSSERDAIIKHIGKRQFIAEHQLFIELLTCFSRTISYFVLLAMGFIGNIVVFKVLLVVFMIANPTKYLVMYKQRKIRKEFEELNRIKKEEEKQAKEQSEAQA